MADDEFIHDPQDVLDYSVDWSPELRPGDSISTVVWDLPAGLSRPTGHETDAVNGSVATVWVQGGVLDEDYELRCHVTTTQGRHEGHTITLKCRTK